MADRPILFSGPMVRALLEGRKTQTRRIIKPQPPEGARYAGIHYASDEPDSHFFNTPIGPFKVRQRINEGDRLYVRESWNWTFIKDLAPGETLGRTVDECCAANGGFACPVGDGIVYAATNAHEHPEFGKARWKPSIHMPRWASRLTLVATDVRVQRLQDISEEDAIAEGIFERSAIGDDPMHDTWTWRREGWRYPTPRMAYAALWTEINGPGSWEANPWVAAYTFSAHRCNIDQMEAEHAD
ncbi:MULTISPECIES: hypothetical protein [unclassified Chelatococcus]|uniref:hypothetical protein n=1 Tax=unclassified Chelatococcus TaxID=2638111 RepID=UPI001BCDE9E4|nr:MULTISPECIES: hypothetical protein [unclassified Chelatococcus]MBS7697835.1 hypothetical protein [Chelatococcus sp. YT9]MBS7698567.1 hypothetical protein [Chelatococcus sp. YT9]MBX3559810.1 hypothetical protein [Chelatococcus sp.]